MNNNGKPEKAINLAEICLLCGGKKQEKNPLCATCHDKYVSAGEQYFTETGGDLLFSGWLLQQVKDVLPKAQKEHAGVKTKFDALREQVSQVEESLERTDLQKHLSQVQFDQLVQARGEKLWKDGNGDKIFGEMKRLEDRLRLLPELIEQLEHNTGAKKGAPPNQQIVEADETETAVTTTAA